MSHQTSSERIERLSPAKRALFERLRASDAAARRHRAIEPRVAAGSAPLSFAQQRLWFLDQLDPGSAAYNVATAVRLRGLLDAAVLEQALQVVVDRHEALRTTFHSVDGRAEQAITPTTRVRLVQIAAQSWPVAERESRIQQLAAAEAIVPFDLSTGPLLRATLVRLTNDEHVLFLTIHHIVCDGWSMAVLRDEVADHYAAILAGRPPRMAPLSIQYADFAAWQREQLRGPAVERLLNYWSRQLAGAPEAIELPLDHPRPTIQGFHGDVRRLRLDGALTTELRRLAGEEGATLFMTLLAAFQILLARYSRQKDVCVGTPIANRSRPELEPLIGFFVNTLVIRGRLEGNPSFRGLLAQLRETTLSAFAHQDLPFEHLVEHLHPSRDTSRTPLVQVMFVLQNIPLRSRDVAGLSISDVSFDHAPISNFDLTLNVDEHADRLDLSLVYNTDLFEPDTIERMLASYELLLRGIIAGRDTSVQRLPLVDPQAALGQLAAWNDTDAPFPQDVCIHELISAQAARTPHATALEYENQTFSYAEL
ncbi:MAG TPA: condensation domain-containing protein, partial [Pirellulales bacterium]